MPGQISIMPLNELFLSRAKGVHPDIECQSSNPDRCTNPTWRDPSWLGGNVPDIKTQNPPEKDTVIVPAGGYVVVRFKADNPGKEKTIKLIE